MRKNRAFKCIALLGCLLFVFGFTLGFSFTDIQSLNKGNTTASAATGTGSAYLNVVDDNGISSFVSLLQGAQKEFIYFGTNVTSSDFLSAGNGNNRAAGTEGAAGTPIKWRVLTTNDTKYGDGNNILLWADYDLGTTREFYNRENTAYLNYSGSIIRAVLNGTPYLGSTTTALTNYTGNSYLTTIFTTEEQNFIKATNSLITHDFYYYNSGGYNEMTKGIAAISFPINAAVQQYITFDATAGTATEDTTGDMLFSLDYDDVNDATFGMVESSTGKSYANKFDASWTSWASGVYYTNHHKTNATTTADYLKSSNMLAQYSMLRPVATAGNGFTSGKNSHMLAINTTAGQIFNGTAAAGTSSTTNYYNGVRPAFLFDPSQLVYATTSTSFSNNLNQITSTSADTYKLYMADSAMDTSDANKPSLTFNANNSITATFKASAINANATHAVALLTSNDPSNTDNAVQYQAMVALNGGNTATFALPTDSGFNINDYKISIMLTTNKGGWGNETVYASYDYNNVWARYYDIEIASDGVTKTITEFALTKDKDPDVVEFGGALYNPESDGHGKANHKFLGWITKQEITSFADLNNIKTLAVGLPVEVDLYAVWGVDDSQMTANITPTINSGTLSWSPGDTAASATYAPGRTITLEAKALSVASSVGFNMTDSVIYYQWKKNGADISRATSITYSNIKNVVDSDKYSYEYLFCDKFQPLWIATGTSVALDVTVNPAPLTPVELTTEQTAFIGAPYNEVTPKATMQDPYGNTVTGTTFWRYNTATSIQPDDPNDADYREGYVWAIFCFTPDASYNGNYGDGTDSGKNIEYEFQFKISYLQLEFSMPELSESIYANIIYGGDLSHRTIANDFDTAFAAYYAQNAATFDRYLKGLTPVFEIDGDNSDGKRTDGATFTKINDYRAQIGYAYNKVKDTIKIEVFFDPENYTVTFKFNDNGATDDRIESDKKYNEQLSEPATPTNGNLLFTGWYYDVTDDNGATTEVRWDFDNRLTGDLTLTAHWLEAKDLDRIEITKNKATYSAQSPIQSGDLTVTAYFTGELDGNTITVPVVLTWSEFSSFIKYDPDSNFNDGVNGFDRKLHVLFDSDGVTKVPFTVGVSYSFGSKTVHATVDLDITPVQIDLSDLNIADKKVTYNGSAQSIDSISIAQIQALADPNSSFINSISYTYRFGRNEIDQTDVIAIGNYTVTISFGTSDPDFYAQSITVSLQILAQADVLTVTWDSTTFQYNAKVQHPTPIFTDADGNVLTNVQYHFEGDDNVSARGSYSITVILDTAGFTLSGATTTPFTITKATLAIPTIKPETSIIYTGQSINLADFLDGFDPDIMTIVDGGIKIDAGNNYVATISLTDLNNCEWIGTSSQTVTVNWAIEKAHLTAGWNSSEYVADGNVFQPVVDRFLAGLSPVDANAVDYANDILYTGDLNMTAVGAYTITASLNASADWTKNYVLDGNASWAFVIVPRAGMDVITIEWDNTEFVFNGAVQKPNFIIYDRNGNDITAQVTPYLTVSGDGDISKWAGSYSIQLSVDENSNYFIRSGAVCNYTITTDPVTGEGVNPENPTPGNDGSDTLNKIKEFFEKLLASHFPLWQVITMAVSALLALIFMIKAIQYGNRAKKAKGETKKIRAKAYAAFLPIFSTETVALGLSNQIWSIMAFAFVGLALLMFVIALITRHSWKKAELAKENALEEAGINAQNGNQLATVNGDNSAALMIADLRREMKETLTQVGGQGVAQTSDSSLAIIQEMRREMEERRREEEERRRADEERHRQEMDAMKMMFANMMGGRPQGEEGFTYASMDDTDMLVQRVIAGLLPAVQQMMPEATAYLAAPQEQNEELIALVEEQKAIVEEQNEEIRNMSAQMSELQEQLAAMSQERADAVILPDSSEDINALTAQIASLQEQIANMSGERAEAVILSDNNDEILAQMNALQEQIANLSNGAGASYDNSDEMKAMSDELTALREQIANLGNQSVTVVAPEGNNGEIMAEMNAMREQIAKLSQTQYDTVILDEDDDDFDDEEEWDCVLDEDDEEEFAESVIVESDGTVRKVYPNFRMRLKQSSDKNREWYAAIKNLFCSQKNITYRVYKRVEKIRYQGNVIAVIGIAKRSIKLWLALKPYEYDARRYHHKDVSDKTRFVDVPLYVRVGSDRALTRAQELILALFQEQATEPRKRYTDRDIQELIFTLKYNKLLTKQNKGLLREVMHVHDCDVLDNEIAEKCIESKNVEYIDDSVIETVKLDDIDMHFQDGNRVTVEKLRKLGLVSAECTGYNVTAGQRLTKPLIIVANDFTMEAVKMIALTGGRVIKLTKVSK